MEYKILGIIGALVFAYMAWELILAMHHGAKGGRGTLLLVFGVVMGCLWLATDGVAWLVVAFPLVMLGALIGLFEGGERRA